MLTSKIKNVLKFTFVATLVISISLWQVPHVFAAGIAFDAVSRASITAGSAGASFSHTVTGTNNVLFVGCQNNTDTRNPTAVQYNGVAMTLAHLGTSGNGGQSDFLYYLFAPSTGTNNVTVFNSDTPSGINWLCDAVSYNGVSQVGLDATNYVDGSSGSPATKSITTSTNNSWAVLYAANADASWAASTGSTARNTAATDQFFDSNGPITPAGSYSMSLTYGGVRTYFWGQVSIAPVAVRGGMWQFQDF